MATDHNPHRYLFVITHTTLNTEPHPDKLTQTHLEKLEKARCFGKGNGQNVKGDKFRLYDDDGNLYYQGVMYDDGSEVQAFAPLQWGAYDAGCTTMRVQNARGGWDVL